MNNKTLPLNYANGLMLELEKAFYDERGKGARFRTTTVGRSYFREHCLPRIASSEISGILPALEKALCEDGIVASLTYSQEERLLRVRVDGCVHRPVEEAMVAHGVEPFTCIPANLVVLALEEKLDRPVELAEIKVEDGACALLLAVFDHRPTLA
ncbi:MAG: hypothetical protein NTU91_13980 [Chloroflexi bacterium]|nr:hypothetical protein [Chloroflexota bacterium]